MSSVLRVVTVLGKRLSPSGQPEPELVDRCATAARVARAGQADSEAALVIPTGGDPARAGVTEAAVMARLLAEAGVAAARIVPEPRARTTAENAINVLQLVAARLEAAEAGSEVRLVVVTSAYHLPLALWMFRQAASVLQLRVSVRGEAALGAGAGAEASVRQVLGMVEAAPSMMRLGLVRAGLLAPDQEPQLEDTAEVAAETRKLLGK